jgi:hypothetical protein
MADRLAGEDQRWRAAIRARRWEEARAILRRVNDEVNRREAESRTQPVQRAKVPPSSDASGPRPAGTYVTLPQLARELGIDPRTLKNRVDGQPFVWKLSERITLIDVDRFRAWSKP